MIQSFGQTQEESLLAFQCQTLRKIAAPFAPAWNALIQEMPAIRKHAVNWQNSLKNQPDLAGSLVKFCADKV